MPQNQRPYVKVLSHSLKRLYMTYSEVELSQATSPVANRNLSKKADYDVFARPAARSLRCHPQKAKLSHRTKEMPSGELFRLLYLSRAFSCDLHPPVDNLLLLSARVAKADSCPSGPPIPSSATTACNSEGAGKPIAAGTSDGASCDRRLR